MVLAVNVVQHVSLGRFGEALDPDGDLALMATVEEMLAYDGVLLLGVPVAARDVLVWNAHRLFGPLRLPLLLEGWSCAAAFGAGNVVRSNDSNDFNDSNDSVKENHSLNPLPLPSWRPSLPTALAAVAPENAALIGQSGIAPLVALLANGSTNAQSHAAGALANCR